MIILLLIYSLLCSGIMAKVNDYPLRKFSIKFKIPISANRLVQKLALSIRQQQKDILADLKAKEEEKRQKIYKDLLLSRVKGPVLKDFYSRF